MGQRVAEYLRSLNPPAGPHPGERGCSAARGPAQATTGELEPAPLSDKERAAVYKLDLAKVRDLAREQIERAKALMERVTSVRWYDFVPVLGPTLRWGDQLKPYLAARDKLVEAERLYERGERSSSSAENVRKADYASAYFDAYEATSEAARVAKLADWDKYLVQEARGKVQSLIDQAERKSEEIGDAIGGLLKLAAAAGALYGGIQLLEWLGSKKEQRQ